MGKLIASDPGVTGQGIAKPMENYFVAHTLKNLLFIHVVVLE